MKKVSLVMLTMWLCNCLGFCVLFWVKTGHIAMPRELLEVLAAFTGVFLLLALLAYITHELCSGA